MKLNKRQLLFCPGPINVASNIKQAVLDNEIGHRETEFSILLNSLNRKLLTLFKVTNHKYLPLVITGSGTAANEAILSSVVGEKHILVLANGEFGERLYAISQIHNKNTHLLNYGWGRRINLKKLEAYLASNSVDFVAMVHHETSTGMLNPIQEIGKLVKKYHSKFIVDTVSSAGTEIIDLIKSNITFCSGSASKALGSLPGLSFVIGKIDELQKLKDLPVKVVYLNLYKFYHFSINFLQTPNTPAVQLFFALDQALSNILNNGINKKAKEIAANAKFMRSKMKKMGLEFLLQKKDMSNFLTTVYLPKKLRMDKLKRSMKEKNIVIYDGKGPLKDLVFQVGHVGELSIDEINFFLDSLKEILAENRKENIVRKYISHPYSFLNFDKRAR